MSDDATGYSLLLEFDSDEPAFTRGVEVGRLWTILADADLHEVTETVHASNAEMMLRLAEARGFDVQSEDLDETWIVVTFTRRPRA